MRCTGELRKTLPLKPTRSARGEEVRAELSLTGAAATPQTTGQRTRNTEQRIQTLETRARHASPADWGGSGSQKDALPAHVFNLLRLDHSYRQREPVATDAVAQGRARNGEDPCRHGNGSPGTAPGPA